MKLSKFKFNLPQELIALHPAKNRDESRLMIVNRKTGEIVNNFKKLEGKRNGEKEDSSLNMMVFGNHSGNFPKIISPD